MAFKRITPEEQAARAAADQHERDRKRVEAARRAFASSPPGEARAAKRDGQTWYQVAVPIQETGRTIGSWVFGEVTTSTSGDHEQGALIGQIEAEGWELRHAGFVFQETGAVSRDKFLSSGQSIKTTGNVIGVYLFRATSAEARTDEPWRLG